MDALREKMVLRRKGFENKRDFLQSLLSMDQSDKRDGELLHDEQILDNILTLIIAGMGLQHLLFTHFIIFICYIHSTERS